MFSQMKGLNAFITDIRGCQNKDQEQMRCEQELAKIKTAFANNRNMSGYDKKKYVWKLLYMYILGYEIDMGHLDAALLINCAKFSEKYTGYVATSILITQQESHVYDTIASSVKQDLRSGNEVFQSMALAMIGAQAPYELVKVLKDDVIRLALDEGQHKVSFFVKKKALLCLLRMFRKYQDEFCPEEWVGSIFKMFDQVCWSLGFLSSLTAMVIGLSQFMSLGAFEGVTPKVVRMLEKLVINRDCPKDYLYYQTPNPWVQVKLLRLLQKLPFPDKDSDSAHKLISIVQKIIQKTEVTKHQNKNNADHGVLFEAAKLILINYDRIPDKLKKETVQLLGIFIQVKEPNIRYLALETVCQFNDPAACEMIMGEYLKYVLAAMKDQDISIKRRALDILYHMCHPQIAQLVVEEMLTFIETSDVDFQEELVLKVAILAEKFAQDLFWYTDTVIKLIQTAGTLVTDHVWYRLIQMVTGFGNEDNQALRLYVAQKVWSLCQLPYVNSTIVKIGAYVLAEFSCLLVEKGVKPEELFETMHQHFLQSDNRTKALMLNGFAKLGSRHPDVETMVLMVFQSLVDHVDIELQQRALEFMLLYQQDPPVRLEVLKPMPNFSHSIQNANPLIKRIYNIKGGKTDKHQVDPTVLLQSKQVAQEQQSMFKGKSPGQTAQDNSQHLSRLQKHPAFPSCQDKISKASIALPSDYVSLLGSAPNVAQFKALLTSSQSIVYQDSQLTVQYKSEFSEGQGRIAMQFEGRSALTNVSVLVHNSDGLLLNISPVKYNQHPVVMMELIANSPAISLPVLTLYYTTSSEQKVSFALPITPLHFVVPVSLSPQALSSFYHEYTHGNNTSYFRLDDFLQNPAPENVPLPDVLKKLGNLLQSLNLKVTGSPEEISGSGQLQHKNDSDQLINIPVVVQIQSFPAHPRHLRISLRSAVCADVVRAYYQAVCFVVNTSSSLQ